MVDVYLRRGDRNFPVSPVSFMKEALNGVEQPVCAWDGYGPPCIFQAQELSFVSLLEGAANG